MEEGIFAHCRLESSPIICSNMKKICKIAFYLTVIAMPAIFHYYTDAYVQVHDYLLKSCWMAPNSLNLPPRQKQDFLKVLLRYCR